MSGIIILTVFALLLGLVLALVESLLTDKTLEENLRHLPGYNCGACGYGSCMGMAEAMKNDIMEYRKCRVLRGERLEAMKKYASQIERSSKM